MSAAFTSLAPTTLLLALLSTLAALCLNMLSWRAAMAAVGGGLRVRPAARAFFLSQLGKYVPGSVWPVVAQMELTRDSGISRARSATGALVGMAVGVVTSGAFACALLVLPDAEVRRTYWWLLLGVPLAATVLVPSVLSRLLAVVARAARRATPVTDLRGRDLVRSAAWSSGMWMCFGFQAWLIARDLDGAGAVGYWLATGAFALAWVVGFVVVLAPAGLGAREAALVLALSGTLDPADALALAIISRVVTTLGDGLVAAGALVFARRGPRPDDLGPDDLPASDESPARDVAP
ncbi:lysylphosphatidylglycerol synthase domain-containing protein [Cellulomonas sp. ATA003]|uniref:lysylphosphatidylglycerol synthase domain-containing protein n=1 Tax=Cellulomonas sp. ATA003 TaxID=3073064 RepID=UPI00287390B8|nr:lysylphosphatidylglycerol synthase domain-containing protein [Cellulomonas sp. ATA003]WNB86328.1 lysylphosphatidylglycerol synthase domain-containing protein [Cellulomonas sp. ATA003]